MLKSAILRTTELDMSWVLGLCGGGGLKAELEAVLILPAKGAKNNIGHIRGEKGGEEKQKQTICLSNEIL